LPPGDPIRPAWILLQQAINGEVTVASSTTVVKSPDGLGITLAHSPRNLLALVWLQFARAIADGLEFGRCKRCNRWFEGPGRGRRFSRDFCGDSCRSAAYRDRRDRARRLAAEGVDAEVIAEQVGSDVETVRAWVGGQKAGPKS
jgi:hypothetical protein